MSDIAHDDVHYERVGLIAREIYREMYPAPIKRPPRERSIISNKKEQDQAYDIWDARQADLAATMRCWRIASRIARTIKL